MNFIYSMLNETFFQPKIFHKGNISEKRLRSTAIEKQWICMYSKNKKDWL